MSTRACERKQVIMLVIHDNCLWPPQHWPSKPLNRDHFRRRCTAWWPDCPSQQALVALKLSADVWYQVDVKRDVGTLPLKAPRLFSHLFMYPLVSADQARRSETNDLQWCLSPEFYSWFEGLCRCVPNSLPTSGGQGGGAFWQRGTQEMVPTWKTLSGSRLQSLFRTCRGNLFCAGAFRASVCLFCLFLMFR